MPRRKSWLAILANFLEERCALGFLFKRKSQVHRGHGLTSMQLAVMAIFVWLRKMAMSKGDSRNEAKELALRGAVSMGVIGGIGEPHASYDPYA